MHPNKYMKKMLKHSRYICIALLLLSLLSCKNKEESYQKIDFVFDTVCSIQVFTEKNEQVANVALQEAFNKLRDLELIFSPTLKESETVRLNNANINVEIAISKEVKCLLEENLKIAELTHGSFNPCMGHLTNLWRPLWNVADENVASLPSKDSIESALKYTDYTKINFVKNSIIKKQAVCLDFGASAKGYATDCIKEVLTSCGIKRAIIDLGGNVAVLGKKEDGSKWKVGIKMPVINSQQRVAGYVNVSEKAVVSSGNYERFFKKDGKIYHHIISSEDGMPVENELSAVTIIASKATLADILSTSCFVLGAQKSILLLKQFSDVSAIFFFKNGNVLQVNKNIAPFFILDKDLKAITE